MKMSIKEYTKILSGAKKEEVCAISKIISDKHNVRSVRPTQKTLTMIKMREPINSSLFYLGEALCCECMVEVDGIRGICVMMGDDFEKVTASAVIDAAFNGKFAEVEQIENEIIKLGDSQKQERATMNAEILKSKVDFNLMGEN